MTTYTFTGAVAYDRLGSSWRTAAGLRSVSVTDPATGLLPTGLTQGGVAVSWLTADANSRYSFTCDVPGVVVDFGAGSEALYANEVPGLAIAAGGATNTAIDARMKWAPSTAYTLGQQVVSPNSDIVKANVAHTSAAAYATDVAKWDLSATLNGKVAKGDIVYRVADYANPQAAIDAAPAGAVVLFPPGGVTITTALSVTKALTLRGQGLLNSTLTANGCNGINIGAGQTQVNIESMQIAAQTLYTTTANTQIGVLVDGSDASSPGYDVFQDLRVIGFKTAIQTRSLQSSRFERVYTYAGLLGIDAYGTSENNIVHGCNLMCSASVTTRLTGSVALRLNGQVSPSDSTSLQSEGWIITDNLFAAADILVHFHGVSHCVLANSILDFAYLSALSITNNGTAWGGGIKITGNYMAMAAANAAAGGCIEVANATGSMGGAHIIGNKVLAYGDCPFGIHVATGSAGSVKIIGNTVGPNFHYADVQLETGGHMVTGNECQSAIANQLVANVGLSLVADNLGVVYIATAAPNTYSQLGAHKVCSWTAAPTTLTWAKGDRIVNSVPAVGSPKAWTCTVAGTPGTWVSEGNL